MLEDFPLIIKILFYFLGSFIITFILLPKIIQIAHQKELMVQPNKRSSHRVSTPAFGGVAFFISFIFMFSFLRNEYMIYSSNFIVPALTVLFVLGLKDDLVSVSPRTKILGQLLAIILILLSGEFIVYNLNGFMGIYQVSVWVLMPILVFLMLGIINAYNLIDGADGLASSVGLVIMGFFGYMFYQLGETFYFLTTFIIIGSFCAFLRFNLSKNIEKRLFMGDTGSLFIGFVMVIFTLKLLTIPVNHFHQTGLLADNLVCFIAGILFVPLFDTTRVMIIRYSEKKSILNPDRNHIHHLLLDSGFTHFETSLIVSFLAFLIMFSILQFSFIFNSYWLILVLLAFYISLFIFFHYIKVKITKNNVKITA